MEKQFVQCFLTSCNSRNTQSPQICMRSPAQVSSMQSLFLGKLTLTKENHKCLPIRIAYKKGVYKQMIKICLLHGRCEVVYLSFGFPNAVNFRVLWQSQGMLGEPDAKRLPRMLPEHDSMFCISSTSGLSLGHGCRPKGRKRNYKKLKNCGAPETARGLGSLPAGNGWRPRRAYRHGTSLHYASVRRNWCLQLR